MLIFADISLDRYGNTSDIQENQEAVDAYREERRCACVGTHWHA